MKHSKQIPIVRYINGNNIVISDNSINNIINNDNYKADSCYSIKSK